ncbi:uncharacterized protein [Venturia canescens]|uniref:uncharacterized protein n=1 Tax=Venturia canescens TaxID=32260 RepID=UPI001C9D50C9|nr:uncharacterized protein LOC122412310 [Venturia canescens]
MTAKRKQSTSAKESRTSSSWIEALEAITINDENWWCTMSMIVETVPSQIRSIEFFEEPAENGSRRAIHVLTLKKLMNSVKSLSKIDESKCPVAQRVFHQANRLIARGENLESWLTARLVKYLVYRAKMETMLRVQRETDIEHEIDRSIRALLPTTNAESERSIKSAKTKDSDQAFDLSVRPKSHTYLRKRGQIQKNKFYVDDSPESGPHLFIILTGFRDPNLPLELMKAGLPLICVLKMKNPEDDLGTVDNTGRNLQPTDKVVERKKSNLLEKLTEKELAQFWETFEKSLNHEENIELYSSVMIRNFCPPEIPSYDDHGEIEKYKKDLYDRVSYIVYDLFDLQTLHAEYLRSIKVLHIPAESPGDSKIYMTIMNAVPAECSFVSVILQAMISQVEANISNEHSSNESVSNSYEISGFHEKSFVSEASENNNDPDTSLIVDNDRGDHKNNWKNHIQERNLTTRLIPKELLSASRAVNRRVILECDYLELKTHHVPLNHDIIKLVKPEPTSLAEFAERSYRNPRVLDLWKNHDTLTEDAKKKHQNCIKKIAQCLSFPVNSKRLIHYLHLRFFDKMIHDRLNPSFICDENHEGVTRKNKGAFPLAVHSEPFPLASRDIQTDRTLASGGDLISNLLASKSDSIIDYHVARGDDILGFQEMSVALKNSHKMLADLDPFTETGSEKVGKTRGDSSYLEEFIDARLLSTRTLLQAVDQCFQKYQRFYSEYSEITDSMLLCFGHVDKPRKSSQAKQNEEKRPFFFYDDPQSQQTFKIVTPVCLRNFCEYVIHQEKDFIRHIEKMRFARKSMSPGELTRKLSQHSDIGILGVTTFDDHDFILPNSLKGQTRRKISKSKSLIEMDIPLEKIDPQTVKSDTDHKKKKNNGGESSSRKIPSLRCAKDDESYKFIGYDIGPNVVHLTTRSETFLSPDGTLVKVDLDEWLHGKKILGIGIDLQDCFLKVERTIGSEDDHNQPFHLTTNNGIVMAFSQISRVDLRIVRADSFENPFYIQQRYVSKGSECENVSRESYRKFLRNGTVLKFLGDNEIEVLRPNGTIVRCFGYDKFSGEFVSGSNTSVSKGRNPLIEGRCCESQDNSVHRSRGRWSSLRSQE